MSARFTLDTNVLVDANDLADRARQALAESLIRAAAASDCALTLQAIGEFYFVITRKGHASPAIAAYRARQYAAMFALAAPSMTGLDSALASAEKGRFAFWDAYLLAAASEAGCTICLSSDMHDGAKLGAITVRRPFEGNNLSKAARALLSP